VLVQHLDANSTPVVTALWVLRESGFSGSGATAPDGGHSVTLLAGGVVQVSVIPIIPEGGDVTAWKIDVVQVAGVAAPTRI
jgi:hypothetical protein